MMPVRRAHGRPPLIYCSFVATMSQQGFEQHGQLSEHPLAELILETSAAGLSGAFRLARESVKIVIYLDSGEIVFAVSNLRQHRLHECARRWNVANAEQLQFAAQKSTDAEIGASLVASGALTTEALAEVQSRQVANVLRTALLWSDGSWSFDPRVRLAEDARVTLPVRELLMESARRLPPELVVNRFSNTNETLSPEANAETELEMQPLEAFVLSRFEAAPMRVHELLAISGLPEAETLRAVYALAFGGFIGRERWMRAFTDGTVAKFQAAAAAAAQRTEQAAPLVAPTVHQAPPAETVQPKETVPEVDERQELERFFARLETADDYYEVLGVTRATEVSGIKRAYHQLARSFHPDRFHQEAGTELHARLQTGFARVAQAYETLKDAQARSAYDRRLEMQKKMRRPDSFSPSSTTQQSAASSNRAAQGNAGQPNQSPAQGQAEESFQQGLAALKTGNLVQAISHLGEAARRAPGQPRYRAYYGLSLAGNKQMRHQAEAEFQAAISLDARNASYRIMLAELYKELGMKRRAIGELQRALSIEPQNAEALKLLEDLNPKG